MTSSIARNPMVSKPWGQSCESLTSALGNVLNPHARASRRSISGFRPRLQILTNPVATRVRTGVLLAIKRSKTMSKDFGVMLIFYGLFLVVCGSAGAWLHNFEKKAMHSLYAGLGGSLAMLACGLFAASNIKVLVAIGVHLALVLMLIFIAVFSIQAFKSYGNPEKFDRLVLFVVMGLGSGVALAKAISMKPKKEKK